MRNPTRCVLLYLVVLAQPLAGQAAATTRIHGRILDQKSGRPIGEVLVTLSQTSLTATTESSGRFTLRDVPFGRYQITFERLGYATRVDSLVVEAGMPVDVSVRLATSAIPLDSIVVTVRSSTLRDVGFYDRREFGPHGTFITAADVDRYRPHLLTDLMRRVPGTMVLDGGPGRKLLRFNREVDILSSGRQPPGCEPAVFLDGILIRDQSYRRPYLLDFNRVDPGAIAGIEVYVGAGVPLQYKQTPCGAVLIWTKRGG